MARSGTFTPLISRGRRILATTERHGSSAASWKAIPRRWAARMA